MNTKPIHEVMAEVIDRRGLADTYSLYFDGACEPVNPGGVATCGWLIKDCAGMAIAQGACEVSRGPQATNNVAEWSALGFGLRYMLNEHPMFRGCVLRIFGDSKLVVEQLNGRWKCNKEHLQKLRDRCRALLAEIGLSGWTAEWIPREQNEEADGLSRQAYETATGKKFPVRR